MLNYFTSYLGISAEEIRHHPEWLINAFDHNHTVLLWNKKCEEVFKIEERMALGRRLQDLLPYTKGHEKIAHLQRALSGYSIHILNDSFRESKETYEQKIIPIRDNSQKIIAALNIVRFHKPGYESNISLPSLF